MKKHKRPRTEQELKRAIRIRFIQLITEGVLTLLAVFLLCNNHSLSWFSANKTVDASGAGVSVSGIDLNAELSVYTHAPEGTDVILSNSPESIVLSPLDHIFDRRNRYSPVVVRLRLSGTELLVNEEILLLISRNGPAASAGSLDRFSSSVLRLTGACGASLYSDIPANLYENVDRLLYDKISAATGQLDPSGGGVGSSLTFTTGTSPSYQKAEQVAIRIPYSPEDIDQSGEKPVLNAYLYLSYDSALCTALMKQGDTVPDFTDPTGTFGTIAFPNDLQDMIISAVPSQKS